MIMKRAVLCLVSLTLAVGASIAAHAESRFALVIGNSKYEGVTALPNPERDADSVAELLSSADFDVTKAIDLDRSDMHRAVSDFAAKLADKGDDAVALIYFAGHGMQVDGENYLLPVDVRLKRETDIALEAIRLADVMNVLNTVPAKSRIVILDACRNNPFAGITNTTSRGLTRVSAEAVDSVARGLAIVNAPPGTLVAYSTSPGSTAEDGTGSNSPFTSAFVAGAKAPGKPVETLFRDVRLAVHKATEGRQTPWEVTALTNPFVFFPGQPGAEDRKPEAKKSPKEWRSELRSMTPEKAYETVIRQDNVTIYQIFLEIHPDSPLGERLTIILDRRMEMLAWYEAIVLNTVAALNTFLDRHPLSDLAPAADRLLQQAVVLANGTSGSRSVLGIATAPPPKTVIKEIIKEVRVPVIKYKTKTVTKEVPVIKYKTRTVTKEVPVIKYKTKTVVKEVPVIKTKTVVKKVPVIKYKTKTVIKKVPVVRTKTVIKKVPVVRIKTVVKRVPVVRIKTVVKRVPVRVPCRCTGGGRRPRLQ